MVLAQVCVSFLVVVDFFRLDNLTLQRILFLTFIEVREEAQEIPNERFTLDLKLVLGRLFNDLAWVESSFYLALHALAVVSFAPIDVLLQNTVEKLHVRTLDMNNGHRTIGDVGLDQLRQVQGLILGLVRCTEGWQVDVDAQ